MGKGCFIGDLYKFNAYREVSSNRNDVGDDYTKNSEV